MSEGKGIDILGCVRKISFFKSFAEEEVKQLSEFKNHVINFKKDKVIVRQNDIDLSLFVLIRGTVALTKNEKPKLKIAVLQQGAVFGEVSLLNPTPRITNVVADSNVTVLKMDGEMFERLSPVIQGKIKDNIIEMLARRLDNINNTLITYARR